MHRRSKKTRPAPKIEQRVSIRMIAECVQDLELQIMQLSEELIGIVSAKT